MPVLVSPNIIQPNIFLPSPFVRPNHINLAYITLQCYKFLGLQFLILPNTEFLTLYLTDTQCHRSWQYSEEYPVFDWNASVIRFYTGCSTPYATLQTS